MRNSKYWDDFNRRLEEIKEAYRTFSRPPIRRVAVFVTDKCNFRCQYCNSQNNEQIMEEEVFDRIVKKYGENAIIHITGGEPSIVKWLYPYLIEHGARYRFHLNSNCYIPAPAKAIKRLKVSLDSCDANYWNYLIGVKAFNRVINNIKSAAKDTVVSITYTLTQQNILGVLDFVDFYNKEFSNLYAVFFSIYKGTNPKFIISDETASTFFDEVIPKLLKKLDDESSALLQETLDEKRRLMQGIRFKQNGEEKICYLSASERVFSPSGNEYTCSHLYRDGIFMKYPYKHEKCLYGCNQRLVMFNKMASNYMKGEYYA